MLSQRYYITAPTNNENWPLEQFTGYEFEEKIYDLLTQELDGLWEQNISIEKTPATRDDGKDIILTSEIDLENIFYKNFYIKNQSTDKNIF